MWGNVRYLIVPPYCGFSTRLPHMFSTISAPAAGAEVGVVDTGTVAGVVVVVDGVVTVPVTVAAGVGVVSLAAVQDDSTRAAANTRLTISHAVFFTFSFLL